MYVVYTMRGSEFNSTKPSRDNRLEIQDLNTTGHTFTLGWPRPSDVQYDRFRVYWRIPIQDPGGRRIHPTREMLERFLGLRFQTRRDEDSAYQMAQFIAEWGSLGVRRIRLPGPWWQAAPQRHTWAKHFPKNAFHKMWVSMASNLPMLRPKASIFWTEAAREALIEDMAMARGGPALLARSCLRNNYVYIWEDNATDDYVWGRDEMWEWRYWHGRIKNLIEKSDSIDAEVRFEVIRSLRDWMNIAGLNLALSDSGDFGITTDNVFAGLVLQVITLITGVGAFALCSRCGRPYEPSRQPSLGQLHYCGEECRRHAHKLSMRKQREKQRTAFASLRSWRQDKVRNNNSDRLENT